MELSPSWKAIRSSASQEFPTFYGTLKFVTALTRARHLSLFWANSIYSMPPIPLLEDHFNTVFLSTPGSSKWSLFLKFPHKFLYAPPITPMAATFPASLTHLDLIIWIMFGEYRSLSSSLSSLVHSPVISFLLDPIIFFSTLFSKTVSLCSSLSVRDQVSYTYKNRL